MTNPSTNVFVDDFGGLDEWQILQLFEKEKSQEQGFN